MYRCGMIARMITFKQIRLRNSADAQCARIPLSFPQSAVCFTLPSVPGLHVPEGK